MRPTLAGPALPLRNNIRRGGCSTRTGLRASNGLFLSGCRPTYLCNRYEKTWALMTANLPMDVSNLSGHGGDSGDGDGARRGK